MRKKDLPLGKQLRIKRIMLDLTQKELAHLLDIDRSNLAKIETCVREVPKHKEAEVLAYLDDLEIIK